MNTKKQGVLPSQDINMLVEKGSITSLSKRNLSGQIQPSSLDLTLGVKAWRIRASFLPGRNFTVEERLKTVSMHELNLNSDTVFEKGCIYIVKLNEGLNLNKDIYGTANAKSSSGRIDLFTRLLSNFSDEFDNVRHGYSGPLYAEIHPKSFSVVLREGIALNQVRFKKGKVIISDANLIKLQHSHKLVNTTPDINNGLGFSINLRNLENDLVGFKARTNAPIINLSKINYYKPEDFWEEIRSKDASLILNPNDFYILSSRESVNIPPDYAAEMLPYSAKIGEFRVHYAGFFDPGFGSSNEGESKAVLEVRCHEAPFILEHGQQVGRLIFEKMLTRPKIIYGKTIHSNYQGQKLKLSKHFKEPIPT
ncbi:MAG: 2'-deoxycytidine 5'-triphosphate deaminase [Paracoccaceae bacterium]